MASRHALLLALIVGTAAISLSCTFDDASLTAVSCRTNADCAQGFCSSGVCQVSVDNDVLDVPIATDTADGSDVPLLCAGLPCATSCCDGICCADAEACCDGVCTNPLFDSSNCGTCGAPCLANQICTLGACQCTSGFDDCTAEPGCETDLLTDAAHCGGCETTLACAAAKPTCADGTCTCGGALCGDMTCCDVNGALRCIDVSKNAQHCGGCLGAATEVCRNGERCVAGGCFCGDPVNNVQCAADQRCCPSGCAPAGDDCACGTGPACTSAETCCGATGSEACVDLQGNDHDNCGACGQSCGDGACVDGNCECAQGLTLCGTACLNLLNDGDNCGECGNTCGDGESCCGGVCTATDASSEHCGGCGVECPGACAAGECDCGNTTTSLLTDDANCGTCGNDCDGHPDTDDNKTNCVDGACAYFCSGGHLDCTADLGCETNPSTSDLHCGGCNQACPSGTACVAGKCECEGNGDVCPGWMDSVATATCDGDTCTLTCADGYGNCDGGSTNGCERDLRTHKDHCGACGNKCEDHDQAAAGSSCVSSVCKYKCDGDWGDCDDVDPDPPATLGCEIKIKETQAHCGACGQVCPAGASCAGFACTCGSELCGDWYDNVALAACNSGTCELTCETDFADCDGQTSTGCETDLRENTSCGACGNNCTQHSNVTSATCNAGTCEYVCDPDLMHCPGQLGCLTAATGSCN